MQHGGTIGQGESYLLEMLKHNKWANERLLDACSALNEAQLGATLLHIAHNEDNYLWILTGEVNANPLKRGEFPGIEDLRLRLHNSGEKLLQAARTDGPSSVFTRMYQGTPMDVPAMVVYMQVINHATEHRGQAEAILTQLGVTPPAIDAWAYCADGQA